MKNVDYHLSGVCGTAMATLAAMLQQKGYRVSGSDVGFYPPMDQFLNKSGIEILSGYNGQNLKRMNPETVIIGNALSRGNPEVEYCLEHHLVYRSSAEVLKEEFIRGNRSIVITGTHGKTTTASMAAHVFDFCGKNPGYFIGGIPGNFSSPGRAAPPNGYFITEGDEYDTAFFDKRSKFFHYLPDCLILNNLEFDHRDIFENLEQILRSFRLMLRQIPKNGKIFVNGDDPNAMKVIRDAFSSVITVGENSGNNVRMVDFSTDEKHGSSFLTVAGSQTLEWEIPVPGKHNAKNAIMVIALALSEGLTPDSISDAISCFRLPKRRLEKKTENSDITLYDDFAHHPTAIAETLAAVRAMHPKNRLIAVYEPRSNTSIRKDHQEQMAPAFQHADRIFFTKLHRGENLPPEERLDLKQIVRELNEQIKDRAQIIEESVLLTDALENMAKSGDVFVMMSQGDFSGLPKILADSFDKK